MKYKTKAIILLAAILLLLAALYAKLLYPKSQKLTLPNGSTISIEIADNPAKHAKGLMYRKYLDQNAGMLFIFDSPFKYAFWMKNTLIPLDIIWLDENMQIVDITYNTQPCKSDERCKTYIPAKPAKYVLEVNAGFSERNNLKVGDTLKM